jgi:hypothetical protein
MFGGCFPNENNFETIASCQSFCAGFGNNSQENKITNITGIHF